VQDRDVVLLRRAVTAFRCGLRLQLWGHSASRASRDSDYVLRVGVSHSVFSPPQAKECDRRPDPTSSITTRLSAGLGGRKSRALARAAHKSAGLG